MGEPARDDSRLPPTPVKLEKINKETSAPRLCPESRRKLCRFLFCPGTTRHFDFVHAPEAPVEKDFLSSSNIRGSLEASGGSG